MPCTPNTAFAAPDQRGDLLSATPPSYPLALQWARGSVRGVWDRWVSWRDGTRALVRCSSDVQPKPLQSILD